VLTDVVTAVMPELGPGPVLWRPGSPTVGYTPRQWGVRASPELGALVGAHRHSSAPRPAAPSGVHAYQTAADGALSVQRPATVSVRAE
jgi:hypothetical protein